MPNRALSRLLPVLGVFLLLSQARAQAPGEVESSDQAAAQAAPTVDSAAPLQGSEAQPVAAVEAAPAADEQPLLDAEAALPPELLMIEEEPSYPRLSLYGFADFSYAKMFVPKSNLLGLYIPTTSSFAVGNVNLYVDSQISRRARSLIEARFSFLPNGVTTINPATSQVQRTSTDVNDYRILGRVSQWGSIALERVVLSYDITPWLTATVGRFITPWGIWNIDHGTPSLISVQSPLFIDDQYIPARQTGLQLNGQWAFPSFRAGYFLTLSNGRGPVETYRDFDENKAFGGRAFASFTQLGELTLGFTFYVGRQTNPVSQFVRVPTDGTQAKLLTEHKVSAMEKALAADLKWEYKGALLMGEFVIAGRTYDNRNRAVIETAQAAIVSDGRTQIAADMQRYGAYGTVGYRFQFLGIMPFFNSEFTHSNESFLTPKLFVMQMGLNVRPEPGLVVKLVTTRFQFFDAQPQFFGEDPKYWAINTQVAWAF